MLQYDQELDNLAKSSSAARAHHSRPSMKPLDNTQRFGWVVKDDQCQRVGATRLISRLVGTLALLSLKVP